MLLSLRKLRDSLSMMNIVKIYIFFLQKLLKFFGIEPQRVEVEPGTIVQVWAPVRPKPDKPSIVFLHGFVENGIIQWQFQALSLASNYNVYIPDFLFFGGSITDKPDRTPRFQADCVAKALLMIGLEKCILVGTSYGGMVGFIMAEFYPDLVESMVVSATVMALTESITKEALDRLGFSCWADFLVPTSANGVKLCFTLASYKMPPLPGFIWRHYFEALSDHRKEKIELLEALVIPDKDLCVPQYTQRMHIISGENDIIFKKEVEEKLKEQIGEMGSIQWIEKAGHVAQLERPTVYNKHLKQILASFHQTC